VGTLRFQGWGGLNWLSFDLQSLVLNVAQGVLELQILREEARAATSAIWSFRRSWGRVGEFKSVNSLGFVADDGVKCLVVSGSEMEFAGTLKSGPEVFRIDENLFQQTSVQRWQTLFRSDTGSFDDRAERSEAETK
jgi:hypothetical protein